MDIIIICKQPNDGLCLTYNEVSCGNNFFVLFGVDVMPSQQLLQEFDDFIATAYII